MPPEDVLHASLTLLHSLAAAAWLGSMFYSLTVLQPRGKAFFGDDAQFEEFIATVIPAFQRRFKLVGYAMILLVGTDFSLGVIAHLWR